MAVPESIAAWPIREPSVVGERTFVEVSGGTLEVDLTWGEPDEPTLVFLHEGLGSIDLWRGVPGEVADQVGCPSTVVYSRHGHGHSAPAVLPRSVGYMHHEADVVLPDLLRHLRIDRPVLVGHSDGASIALLFAGAGHDVAGLVCIAPHVVVEPESVAGVEAAGARVAATDRGARMSRYHDDPAAVFCGWRDVWLSPEFRTWNIEDRLSAISAPILLVQGTDDQYGTLAQIDAIEAGVSGSCDRLTVSDAGHSPHLDARERVTSAIADFVTNLS